MSLTKGMGEHWGNYLVASPFRFRLLRKIIKKIIEVVKRLIPWFRRKVKKRFKVTGAPVHVFTKTIVVAGNPSVAQTLKSLVTGSLSVPFTFHTAIYGSLTSKIGTCTRLIGSVVNRTRQRLRLKGDLSSPFTVTLSCDGKKDFRKILLEVLDDLEED